jgi:hypothetical protein
MSFQACSATRKQVLAEIWLNNGMSEELCQEMPQLRQYGFYRRLNSGRLEFLSFCNPEARKYVAMYGPKFNEVLDKLLPEKKK